MSSTPLTIEARPRGSRRRRVAAAVVLALAAFGLAACDAVLVETAPYVNWTADARKDAGAPYAAWNTQLAHCADQWAAHLAANGGGLSHGNVLSCMPPGATKAGENLSSGPNPWSALQAIVNSSGHYANMIDPTWTRFGVGHAVTSSGAVILVWRFSN